jgi:hypothetical protein
MRGTLMASLLIANEIHFHQLETNFYQKAL